MSMADMVMMKGDRTVTESEGPHSAIYLEVFRTRPLTYKEVHSELAIWLTLPFT